MERRKRIEIVEMSLNILKKEKKFVMKKIKKIEFEKEE